MRIEILRSISTVRIKGSCKCYAEKGEKLKAIKRDEESLLVDGKKEKFIVFTRDESITHKIIKN